MSVVGGESSSPIDRFGKCGPEALGNSYSGPPINSPNNHSITVNICTNYFGLVLCIVLRNTMLRIFQPLDCAFDDSVLILTINDREPFITEMRSEPSDAPDSSEMRSTVLCTLLRNTIPRLTSHSHWSLQISHFQ
ncbi:hypothetical protein RHMOL_Rhmol10G0045100 [Rhododendron molle]|uniref:Uncharacterized protein n=1 Tax=Rhododendron molle TaxID=49168 RepID=A0ACC0LYZ7_RHOML|nr:hypothetical protein RHMOL_Rhmol10G0045100 [Rhododendron molle]